MKMNIKKDDLVVVIAGKDASSKGKVLEVDPKKGRALVEGVNVSKRHTKPNATHPNGGIIEQEAPVHISNIMLVDPKTGEATRVGRKKNSNGKLVRYSKKTGELID